MRSAIALSLLMLGGLAMLPGLVEAGHVCDPYPIGRCGDYQRESLVFCYVAGKPLGIFPDATERTNIITVGSGGFAASLVGVGAVSSAQLLAPVLALVPSEVAGQTIPRPGGSDAFVPQQVMVGGNPVATVPAPAGGAVARAYVNMTPILNFVADPLGAPAPTKSLHRETNGSPGLQLVNHRCANFVWFAECEPAQWMDFNHTPLPNTPPRGPDAKVA